MLRDIYTEDHEAFRDTVRQFVGKEIVPYIPEWEAAGIVPASCTRRPQKLASTACRSPRSSVAAEWTHSASTPSFSRRTVTPPRQLGGLQVHLNTVLPYFLEFANDEQKARWFPGFADGSLVSSIAMTEPGTGSDLPAWPPPRCATATITPLTAPKTFITGGINADLVVVVARTSRGDSNRRRGLSLPRRRVRDAPASAAGATSTSSG